MNLSRRRFLKVLTGLTALGLLEPQTAARALSSGARRLSWMAHRTAEAEGAWVLTDVEGEVPAGLRGTLYRVAPGQSENHGMTLRHLFDGDAFVSGFSFLDGKVTLRARFVDTPERREELREGRMLYREFGTLPPRDGAGRRRAGSKNQPSVNIIRWDGRLLGLSEGGHPTEIDAHDLSYRGRWDFHGTLSPRVPFTAHPKFDPVTGEGFAFGVARTPLMTLTVLRMNADGTLTELHGVPLGDRFMIHDMILSKNHLIFVIPPVKFDLAALFSGREPAAGALRYFEREPLRLLVLRRDGSGKSMTFEQPASMVFHNGNAFEADGKLTLDTILTADDSVLDVLRSWSDDDLPEVSPPRVTRLVLDLDKGEVASRSVLEEAQEFPRFDTRRSGENSRFLYTVESVDPSDPFVASRLVRHDLHHGTAMRVDAGDHRALGEAVFEPHPGTDSEERGWVLVHGYDAPRDENFLEIRDAGTLDLQARVWTGRHFPLGFHGNFTGESFVSL